MNNPVDAVPFDVIDRFILFWRSRSEDSVCPEKETYAVMAYAAETILEWYKAVCDIPIKVPESSTITFKKWKCFDASNKDGEKNNE